VGAGRGDGTGLAVEDVDVEALVRFVPGQVERVRLEGDQAAVGAEGRVEAVPVGLEVAGVDAHAGRRARLAVAHEDVRGEVLVEGDQVVGEGREGDNAAVRVQSGLAARRISFCAVGADAGTGRRAAGAVVDEDVALPVRVGGD